MRYVVYYKAMCHRNVLIAGFGTVIVKGQLQADVKWDCHFVIEIECFTHVPVTSYL